MRTLPVAVEFQLPGPQWTRADPDALEVPDAAFLALRNGKGSGDTSVYTPVLTISGGWREDDASLEAIADESLDVLGQQAGAVRLLERDTHGSDRAPALTQLAAADAVVGGTALAMRQGQVVAALVDLARPTRKVVLLYTVTCTEEQFPKVGREFQRFMATVKPQPPGG